jgi:hypothetical protein
MKIEVSNGELIDKVTILEIKLIQISDPNKIINIRQEHDVLSPMAQPLISQIGPLYPALAGINRRLWDIEDQIREFERNVDFGPGFIEAARSVYRLNDERAAIKREINRLTGSQLIEEKSYSAY